MLIFGETDGSEQKYNVTLVRNHEVVSGSNLQVGNKYTAKLTCGGLILSAVGYSISEA